MTKHAQPQNNSKRVEWCERAYQELRQELLPKAPETCCVTVGFPSRGARSQKRKTLGECWHTWKHGEGAFISLHPCLFPKPVKVLETLVHEMIHTIYPESGHNGPFPRIMKEIGLEGKPSSTYAGKELKERLNSIAERLGPLPPGEGDIVGKSKPQSTRMRKWICGDCGQIIRAASDDLDATCNPCGKQFEKA